MKKTYQSPAVEAIVLHTEDIMDRSTVVIDPTNKDKAPVVIGPSIGIDLF